MFNRQPTILNLTPSTVTVAPPNCPLCGKGHPSMVLNRDMYVTWQQGVFIQNAFPNLSAEDREVLISGTHPKCFNELFPEDDD